MSSWLALSAEASEQIQRCMVLLQQLRYVEVQSQKVAGLSLDVLGPDLAVREKAENQIRLWLDGIGQTASELREFVQRWTQLRETA